MKENWNAMLKALPDAMIGWLGVFAVIAVLVIAVLLLGKFTGEKKGGAGIAKSPTAARCFRRGVQRRRRAACRRNTLQSDGRREAQPRMPERLRREKYETGENHATKGRL